jgi:2-iminobutanoate/2-iminopropanoate deaminase
MRPTLVSILSAAVLSALSACRAPTPEHLAAQGALGPYSAAVAHGEFVFLSGKIAPGSESFAAEADAAISALAAELARLGLDLAHVVSATVYLTDMAFYPELNAAWQKRFPAPPPARACVAVSALPGKARVEIQAVAAR